MMIYAAIASATSTITIYLLSGSTTAYGPVLRKQELTEEEYTAAETFFAFLDELEDGKYAV